MSASAFVDTNVLVYAFDTAEPEKRDRARSLITRDPGGLVLSPQVLGEFYVVTTRKLATPLSEEEATEAVRAWSRFRVIDVDAELVAAAIARSRASRISYWDALIVTSAAAAGCEVLLTEDLGEGTVFDGVRVENPFAGAP